MGTKSVFCHSIAKQAARITRRALRQAASQAQKVIALLVVSALLLTTGGTSAIAALSSGDTNIPAGAYQQALHDLVVPSNIGRITKGAYCGSDRVVINIQDLHCHPEVQKNISRTLSILDERYHLGRVYLEGAAGAVDMSWLNCIEDRKVRQQISDKLLAKGELTGSQYYSLQSNDRCRLIGMEDEKLYKENSLRLGKISAAQGTTDNIIDEVGKNLQSAKNIYFNPQQKRLAKIIAEHRDGQLDSGKYYKTLEKYSLQNGIDIYGYRNVVKFIDLLKMQDQLHYSKISKQMGGMLTLFKQKLPYSVYNTLLSQTKDFSKFDELYVYLGRMIRDSDPAMIASFPELGKFFAYINASQDINPLSLAREENRLISEINTALATNTSEREVVFITDFFTHFDDYFKNKITAEDYDYFVKNFDKFKVLYRCYSNDNAVAKLDPLLTTYRDFYEANLVRNKRFVANILGNEVAAGNSGEPSFSNAENIEKTVRSLDQAKDIVVMVTGGFHTTGLEKLLEQKNISYLVITPNVTQGTDLSETVYNRLITEQNRFFSQAFSQWLQDPVPVETRKMVGAELSAFFDQVTDNRGSFSLPKDKTVQKNIESALNGFFDKWAEGHKYGNIRFTITAVAPDRKSFTFSVAFNDANNTPVTQSFRYTIATDSPEYLDPLLSQQTVAESKPAGRSNNGGFSSITLAVGLMIGTVFAASVFPHLNDCATAISSFSLSSLLDSAVAFFQSTAASLSFGGAAALVAGLSGNNGIVVTGKEEQPKTEKTLPEKLNDVTDVLEAALPGATIHEPFWLNGKDTRVNGDDKNRAAALDINTRAAGLLIEVAEGMDEQKNPYQYAILPIDVPASLLPAELHKMIGAMKKKDVKTYGKTIREYVGEMIKKGGSIAISDQNGKQTKSHKLSPDELVYFDINSLKAVPTPEGGLHFLVPFQIKSTPDYATAMNEWAGKITAKLPKMEEPADVNWYKELPQSSSVEALDSLAKNYWHFFDEFSKGNYQRAPLLAALIEKIDTKDILNTKDIFYDPVSGEFASKKDSNADIPFYGNHLKEFYKNVNQLTQLSQSLYILAVPGYKDGKAIALPQKDSGKINDALIRFYYKSHTYLNQLYVENADSPAIFEPLRKAIGDSADRLNKALLVSTPRDLSELNFRGIVAGLGQVLPLSIAERTNIMKLYDNNAAQWFSIMDLADVLTENNFSVAFRYFTVKNPPQVKPSEEPNMAIDGTGRIANMALALRLVADVSRQEAGYSGKYALRTRKLDGTTAEEKFASARQNVKKMFLDQVVKTSGLAFKDTAKPLFALVGEGQLSFEIPAQAKVLSAKQDFVTTLPVPCVYPIEIRLFGKVAGTVYFVDVEQFTTGMKASGEAKENIPRPWIIVDNGTDIYFGLTIDCTPGAVEISDGYIDQNKDEIKRLKLKEPSLWKQVATGLLDRLAPKDAETQYVLDAKSEDQRLRELTQQVEKERLAGHDHLFIKSQITSKLLRFGGLHNMGDNLQKAAVTGRNGFLYFTPTSCSTNGASYVSMVMSMLFGFSRTKLSLVGDTFHMYTSGTDAKEQFGHNSPQDTGAAKGVGLHLPNYDFLDFAANRVPTALENGKTDVVGGSLFDFLYGTPISVPVEVIARYMERYGAEFPGVLRVFDEQDKDVNGRYLWSKTISGQKTGSIVYKDLIEKHDPNTVRLRAAYDNEMSYSYKMQELINGLFFMREREKARERKWKALGLVPVLPQLETLRQKDQASAKAIPAVMSDAVNTAAANTVKTATALNGKLPLSIVQEIVAPSALRDTPLFGKTYVNVASDAEQSIQKQAVVAMEAVAQSGVMNAILVTDLALSARTQEQAKAGQLQNVKFIRNVSLPINGIQHVFGIYAQDYAVPATARHAVILHLTDEDGITQDQPAARKQMLGLGAQKIVSLMEETQFQSKLNEFELPFKNSTPAVLHAYGPMAQLALPTPGFGDYATKTAIENTLVTAYTPDRAQWTEAIAKTASPEGVSIKSLLADDASGSTADLLFAASDIRDDLNHLYPWAKEKIRTFTVDPDERATPALLDFAPVLARKNATTPSMNVKPGSFFEVTIANLLPRGNAPETKQGTYAYLSKAIDDARALQSDIVLNDLLDPLDPAKFNEAFVDMTAGTAEDRQAAARAQALEKMAEAKAKGVRSIVSIKMNEMPAADLTTVIRSIKALQKSGYAGFMFDFTNVAALPSMNDMAKLKEAVPDAIIAAVPSHEARNKAEMKAIAKKLGIIFVEECAIGDNPVKYANDNTYIRMTAETAPYTFGNEQEMEAQIEKYYAAPAWGVGVPYSLLDGRITLNQRNLSEGEKLFAASVITRMIKNAIDRRINEAKNPALVREKAFRTAMAMPLLESGAVAKVMENLQLERKLAVKGHTIDSHGLYALLGALSYLRGLDTEQSNKLIIELTNEGFFAAEFNDVVRGIPELNEKEWRTVKNYLDELNGKIRNANAEDALRMTAELEGFIQGFQVRLVDTMYPSTDKLFKDRAEEEKYMIAKAQADAFVAKDVTGKTVLLTGYTDATDDLLAGMIAVDGALLVVGRTEAAKEILAATAERILAGRANGVAGQLMFVEALYKTSRKDSAIVTSTMKNAVLKVVAGYDKNAAIGTQGLYRNAAAILIELDGDSAPAIATANKVLQQTESIIAAYHPGAFSLSGSSLSGYFEECPLTLLTLSHNADCLSGERKQQVLLAVNAMTTSYGLRMADRTIIPVLIGQYADAVVAAMRNEKNVTQETVDAKVMDIIRPLLQRSIADGPVANALAADAPYNALAVNGLMARAGVGTIAELFRLFNFCTDDKPKAYKELKESIGAVLNSKTMKAIFAAG